MSVGVQTDSSWPVAPDPGRSDSWYEEEQDEERRPDSLASLQANQIIDFISYFRKKLSQTLQYFFLNWPEQKLLAISSSPCPQWLTLSHTLNHIQ